VYKRQILRFNPLGQLSVHCAINGALWRRAHSISPRSISWTAKSRHLFGFDCI